MGALPSRSILYRVPVLELYIVNIPILAFLITRLQKLSLSFTSLLKVSCFIFSSKKNHIATHC